MDNETAGTLIQAASGAASVVKTVFETIGLARSQVKGNSAAEEKLDATLDLVSDLRSRLFDLQEKALSLQQEYARLLGENMELREDVRREKERAVERQKYQSKDVGSSLLLAREDQPGTFYCPTCFELKKAPIALQPVKRGAFDLDYRCNVCGTTFPAYRAT